MALLLLSGGLDSCILLNHIVNELQNDSYHHIITFNYGQKAVRQEINASKNLVEFYGIDNHEILDIPLMKKFKHDLISADLEVSFASAFAKTEEEKKEIRKRNFIPFRNLTFITLAAIYAKLVEQNSIYIGFHKGLTLENCPDASPEFFNVVNQALQLSILYDYPITVEAPLLGFEKYEAVKNGNAQSAPFHLSYSCYTGKNIHCGKCANCYHRKEAFLKAGVLDPTVYEQ